MASGSTPKVSVLVTVYNREAYLEATLRSILASTFEDFEVIVVDDNSSDHSVEIARQFADQDKRIRVHINRENLTDYPNRMKAASLAQGHYIKYVDSDDLIYPHSLALMVSSMDKYPDAALGLSHSMPEDDSPYPCCLSPEETYKKHFLGRGCLSCGPSGAIIRRASFKSVGGFNADWKVISDIDLWYRLAACCPTVLLPPALVWWRRHGDQEFTKDENAEDYLRYGYRLNAQTLNAPNCPLLNADRKSAFDRSKQHFARKLLSTAFRNGKVSLAINTFRASDLSLSELAKGIKRYS